MAAATSEDLAKADHLTTEAAKLGVSYLLPCYSSPQKACLAEMIPVSAARRLEHRGFYMHGAEHYDCYYNDKKFLATPDVSTLVRLPWDREIGWMVCNLSHDGVPYEKCPRRTLMRVIERVREAGYGTKCGIEIEFTLIEKSTFDVVDKREPHYSNLLNLNRTMNFKSIIKRILGCLTELGWNPYMMEHESNRCQLELNLEPTDVLTTADRFTFAKFMIKELAKEEGCRASFMPFMDPASVVGNGAHVNISLWRGDVNEFHEPDDDLSLSEVGRHFLSGVLQNAAGMCAFVCPTVNSYKRVHRNANACNLITYGARSLLVAVRSQSGERLELRFPDGSMNPYLGLAAVLSAGLDGIIRKTPLDTKLRMDDNVFELPPITTRPKLPLHLEDALRHLQENTTMNEYLGKALIDDYVKLKQRQWRRYLACVTEWEKQFVDSY